MHPLLQSVIKGVRENDLKYCVKEVESRVSDTSNSVYRETLFLTLVSLGQDNIDLTAFDR